MNLTPLSSLRVSKHQIPAHHRIPNTSIQHRPLLHYHAAFSFPAALETTNNATEIEAHLAAVGVVEPQWRYTMYRTTHFHSTTHELLCIAHGGARLCFGGEDNPGREEGDEGFEMVGSYPKGCSWDMCYGKEGEEAKVEGIQRLAWFEKDPVYGAQGPALDV
ncbi:hypothetical protein PG994_005254 [Apiospora phragmitis]|uniref:Uncharacterized protein n=1 Tax=Apiospora phragmitis TaxID=2905665 RepID=A0ABR1VSV5_9PEZI